MKTEYSITKGRGNYWVEMYRSNCKHDAMNRWLELTARHGDYDRVNETETTRTMFWLEDGALPLWIEYAEEIVDSEGHIVKSESRALS